MADDVIAVVFFAFEADDDEEAAEVELFFPAEGVDLEGFPPLVDEEDDKDFILAISANKVLTTASTSEGLDRHLTSRDTDDRERQRKGSMCLRDV